MAEQIEYQSSDISVYCYEDKMIKVGNDFHIIVDEGNLYYVNIVSPNGFNLINRSQLNDDLVKIPFLDFVRVYNSICDKCNKQDAMKDIKDSYTKEELMIINAAMGAVFNSSNHAEIEIKDDIDSKEKGPVLTKVR